MDALAPNAADPFARGRGPWPERVMSDLARCPRCTHRAPRVRLGGGGAARHWRIECPHCGETAAAEDWQGLGGAVIRWNRR